MRPRLLHSLPSPNFRLGRIRDGLVSLPEFGPVYLQGRGPGGGLGKSLTNLQPIYTDGPGFAFDPDGGVGFALQDLEAIHAKPPGPEDQFEGSLDFEFAHFPQGLGIHLLPDSTEPRHMSLDRFLQSVPAERILPEALEAWRRERRRSLPLCHCCRERAAFRVSHPERHPLHAILLHARSEGLSLECRLLADHLDLSARFTPWNVEARDGFLVVSDAIATHALHVNMARLHAMSIDRVRLDGFDYADLRLFDPHGQPTFRILSEDVSLAAVWRDLCEAAS